MDSRTTGHIPKIGILSPATEPGMRDWWREFTQGLNELGYVEGSNIELVWRFADGKFERLPALAAELEGLGVDIIMPATPPAIRAAKSASGGIPIVFPLGSDPVKAGLVTSLDRPGGNITGMATMSWRHCRLRLALVREVIPKAQCVATIYHAANTALELQVEETRAAARGFGLELIVLKFSTAEEIDRTFEVARAKGSEALLPTSDPIALDNAKKIGALSMQHRVPVVSPFREITDAGGIIGYGPDLSTLFRRSAAVVDQVLKGTKPGNIPIGEPQKFDLSINLKSGRALNLTFPNSLVSRAAFLVQ
jgi:putative ABC transport system substrate-binding protein